MFDEVTLQKIYRYCYSLTCNEHDAYDLLQASIEKFIKLNVNVSDPSSYLKKMIYHRFIDDCRRTKIVQFENIDDVTMPTDFDVQTLDELLVNEDMVKQILQSLEPDEREIMYCWAVEGFSTAEIAKKTEKPKGTILSKIYRMRKKLIEEFSENSNDVMEEEK